jgi:hypothetical protein
MQSNLSLALVTLVTVLSVAAPLGAQQCPPPPKPDTPLDYQHREGNRCEGKSSTLRTGDSGTPVLESLAMSVLEQKDIEEKRISFTLPSYDSKHTPSVSLREFENNYLLNNVAIPKSSLSPTNFTFEWSTQVLQLLGVQASALRLLASYEEDGGKFYVPVLLGSQRLNKGKPDPYTFWFYSPRPSLYTAFSIKNSSGKPIYLKKVNVQQTSNSASFSWDGKPQKGKVMCGKGIYRASLQYVVPTFDGNETGEVEVAFVHDPAFLGVVGCPKK